MTWRNLLRRLGDVLSGRPAYERRLIPVRMPVMRMPQVKAPPRRVDSTDKVLLERRQRELDIELARLTAIANARRLREP